MCMRQDQIACPQIAQRGPDPTARAVCKAARMQPQDALPDGAYERLVTKDLLRRLDGLRVARQPVEEVE